MIRKILVSTTLAIILAVTGTATAFASGHGDSDRAEAAMVLNAKTALAQAVAAAEQSTGGKTIEARANGENGSLVYEVEVANANTIQLVTVDAATGKVTAKTSDARDEDRNRDEDHEHGEHGDNCRH